MDEQVNRPLRGRVWTEESRRKLSASKKGQKPSRETIEAAAAKNRGSKLSPEHIEAIRKAMTGRETTPEFRAKMSEIAKKRAENPKYRRKLSESQKGREVPPERRAKISAALKRRGGTTHIKVHERTEGFRCISPDCPNLTGSEGKMCRVCVGKNNYNRPGVKTKMHQASIRVRLGRPLSVEHRRKLSESGSRPESVQKRVEKARLKRAVRKLLGAEREPMSEDEKKRRREARSGYKPHPSAVAKMAEKKRGSKHSPETRAKMSAAHKGKRKSPEHVKKVADAQRGKPRRPISTEHREIIRRRHTGKETRRRMSKAQLKWRAEKRGEKSDEGDTV